MNENDVQLLKQYEPILRFSGGERRERFYPIRVEDYLARCTLWQTRPRLGGVRAFFRREKVTGWDGRAHTLGDCAADECYLHFEPQETAPQVEEAGKGSSASPIQLGCGAFVATAVCLGLAWGSVALGLSWLAGILVYLLAFFLVLAAFGMIMDWADREFPIGIAQVLKGLLASIVVTVFSVPAVTAIAWWLGGAQWSKPAAWVSAAFWIVTWAVYLVLGYGPQFLALVLAPISQVRKKQTDDAYVACQNLSPCYYGRVWPPQGERSGSDKLVLQYFFFYALNDWPTHGGFNYHQGDWEAVFVYLEKQEGEAAPSPAYLGLSAHHKGQAWRWDEVDTEPVGGQEHPVVYVAAGSHANYCEKGKTDLRGILAAERRGFGYLMARVLDRGWQMTLETAVSLNKALKERGGQPGDEPVPAREYHGGDGRVIGPPGLQLEGFTPWAERVLLDDDDLPAWVARYRGLWGFKTMHKDVSGPPGPKWNRLGDVEKQGKERHYWRNPVDWRESEGVMQTRQEEGEG